MSLAFTPAGCCCDDCTIASDTFTRSDGTDLGSNWTEVSGGWSIASNQLDCTSAGIVKHNTATPGSTSAMRVRVKAKATTNGDKAQAIVAYASSTDWIAAEITFHSTSSSGRLKLVDAAGTVLAEQTVTCSLNTWYNLEVCVNPAAGSGDDVITAHCQSVGSTTWPGSVNAVTTVTGTYAGLGATTGTVFFDDFYLEHTAESKAGCTACTSTRTGCAGCSGGIGSTYYKVTIPAGLLSGSGYSGCACSAFEGTWILTPYQSSCSWRVLACTTGGYNFYITLRTNTAMLGDQLTEVYIGAGTGSADVIYRYNHGTTAPDCTAFNGLSLSYHNDNSSYCDHNSGTVTVTALGN